MGRMCILAAFSRKIKLFRLLLFQVQLKWNTYYTAHIMTSLNNDIFLHSLD